MMRLIDDVFPPELNGEDGCLKNLVSHKKGKMPALQKTYLKAKRRKKKREIEASKQSKAR